MFADITDRMRFGLELRNGDPNDPVSNNTSYDGAFQFKEFNLAQGFLDVQATDSFACASNSGGSVAAVAVTENNRERNMNIFFNSLFVVRFNTDPAALD